MLVLWTSAPDLLRWEHMEVMTMGNVARIQVQLEMSEWHALREIARQESRDPRQQARYMLKQLLQQKKEETGQGANQDPVSSHPVA